MLKLWAHYVQDYRIQWRTPGYFTYKVSEEEIKDYNFNWKLLGQLREGSYDLPVLRVFLELNTDEKCVSSTTEWEIMEEGINNESRKSSVVGQ